MLTGLWHGASWNFVLWGVFYGVLLLVEKMFLLKLLDRLPKMIGHVYLIGAMLVGWVFFYFTNSGQMVNVLKTMFFMRDVAIITPETILHIKNNSAFILVAIIVSTPLIKNLYLDHIRPRLGQVKKELPFAMDGLIVGIVMIVATSLLIGETYNPFLYFRF